MNYNLLIKAAQYGIDNPTHFTMDKFKIKVDKFLKGDKSYCKMDCGTAGCLAANIVIVGKSYRAFTRTRYDYIRNVAGDLLGGKYDIQRHIFYLDSPYYSHVGDIPAGTKKYARAIMKGVKAFIKDHKAGKFAEEEA